MTVFVWFSCLMYNFILLEIYGFDWRKPSVKLYVWMVGSMFHIATKFQNLRLCIIIIVLSIRYRFKEIWKCAHVVLENIQFLCQYFWNFLPGFLQGLWHKRIFRVNCGPDDWPVYSVCKTVGWQMLQTKTQLSDSDIFQLATENKCPTNEKIPKEYFIEL